jgi:ABC-type sulfate transport system substrate-binding protein
VTETGNRKAADAFLSFLRTDEAQKIYASKGYRSVKKELVDEKTFPTPAKLFEIDKFGGWSKVNDEFFDPSKGKIAEIFRSQGKTTASD